MEKYSRTEKYRELRNQMQDGNDSDVSSKDLSRLQSRLNRINADNFSKPQQTETDESHDPVHARKEETQKISEIKDNPEVKSSESPFADEDVKENSTDGNDYLDQYIREVKQYNIEQGNAYTTDTNLNVLQTLNKGNPVPKKPYPDEPEPEAHPVQAAAAVQQEATADIPFMNLTKNTAPAEEEKPAEMSAEEITTEVKNLVNTKTDDIPQMTEAETEDEDTMDSHLEEDRTARQQLLNETTQMRSQMDDYEDNLNEVTDKVKHTNRILNFVLVVLILVLLVVLGVVVYWIMLSKGIIG